MGGQKMAVWELDPHTRAKHEILRRYLHAWAPILSHGGFRSMLYVDGFAGPGRYAGGEEGSPIIALNAALAHKASIKATLLFVFVEQDLARAGELDAVVKGIERPDNFRVKITAGKSFVEGFGEVLSFYKDKGKPLPPTFAFIDPFGWTGVPFSLVKEIMSYPNCEVLVNFMYEEINRFISHPDQEHNFDDLFGTRDWRKVQGLSRPLERRAFLHGLYLRQLQEIANVKYVRTFEMRNDKDVTDYFLFYGTNSLKGLAKMKEAMWKVDTSGEFRFSDATNPGQLVFFAQSPDASVLRRAIVDHFAGKEPTVRLIEEFVLAATPFRETHYKRQVLHGLETAVPPVVTAVNPPRGRKIGTYSDGNLRLRFAK